MTTPTIHRALGRRALLALSTLAFALAGAAWASATVGSGQRTSESRQVGVFDAIALSGDLRLVVRQAASAAVQVQADDNLLDLIETQVQPRNGVPTLIVRLRPGAHLRRPGEMVVLVDTPGLGALAAAGRAEVEVSGLKAAAFKLSLAGAGDAVLRAVEIQSLDLQLAGSSDLTAQGRAERVQLSIAGSADADLQELDAADMTVRIAGSGDADVAASRSLKVRIAGSGDLRYRGEPAELRTSIVGSGSVRRR